LIRKQVLPGVLPEVLPGVLAVGGGRTLNHFAGQMTAWPAVVDGGQAF